MSDRREVMRLKKQSPVTSQIDLRGKIEVTESKKTRCYYLSKRYERSKRGNKVA